MTQIFEEGGKTIVKTDTRIDTINAAQFEQDIETVVNQPNINLVMDCTDLNYMASSGLRIIQKTMRKVMMSKGQFKLINVNPQIYKVLVMTGFTKFMTVEQKAGC